LQNKDIGVGREQYFEICEAMGATPVESEIPPELEDFPIEVQQAFDVYYRLPDRWDGMSGSYLGKDLSPLDMLFKLFQISDERTALDFITIIDVTRREIISNKQKRKVNGSKL
jgi:hypothetical protein